MANARAKSDPTKKKGASDAQSFVLHDGALGWHTALNATELEGTNDAAVTADQCKRTEGSTANANNKSELAESGCVQCEIVRSTRWRPCLAHRTESKRDI